MSQGRDLESGASATSLFAVEPERQVHLPRRLREISGLAVTPDGRVMGHHDEAAVICQIDTESGHVVKSFSVGEPARRGDFEGLAVDGGGRFWLLTSSGALLAFAEGERHGWVPFEAFDTGMRHVAELEGLTFDPIEGRLILACKINYDAPARRTMALYGWSPSRPFEAARPWLTLPIAPLAEAVGARAFHPSAFEIDARTGRLIVVAGRENAMVELGPGGELIAARWLGHRHRQAEGATILADGALIIADEGGHARARLTRYLRVQAP